LARLDIQHAGPKLATYNSGTPTTAASVHFAHRSLRFTIRTASQTQKAANATASAGRTMFIRSIAMEYVPNPKCKTQRRDDCPDYLNG